MLSLLAASKVALSFLGVFQKMDLLAKSTNAVPGLRTVLWQCLLSRPESGVAGECTPATTQGHSSGGQNLLVLQPRWAPGGRGAHVGMDKRC